MDRGRGEGVHFVERRGLDDSGFPDALEGHAHIEGILGHHGDACDAGRELKIDSAMFL